MDVMIFEEHSSVLPELWRRRSGGTTLVYLDAHLDLQPINPQRLARLKSCASKEQVQALEKPHHMLPDRDHAYSLEDWLYPAHRLQLFQRLIWVAPPHVPVGFSAQVFAHLQQMDGVRPEELTSFRALPSGGFAGSLAGVDITICNHQQLRSLDLPGNVVVDIDTDYFVEVPGDRAWINPREVFAALVELPSAPELVTISRSVGSGFLPLEYRFLADHLAALWERREADAAHYDRLFAYGQQLRTGASTVAASAIEQEVLRFPGCAATWHLRSTINPHQEDAIRHREQAERLCAAYRMPLLTRACAYPQRELPLDRAAMREMERRSIDEPSSPDQRALVQAALGMICCVIGRIDIAIERYRQCAAHFGAHPQLALEIGKALIAAGRAGDAEWFLRQALEGDKSRTPALACLAQIDRARGDFQRSLEWAMAAHEAAPAWGEVLLLLADLWRRLGQGHKADAMTQRHRLQESQLASLIRLHGAAG